ncbi:50S ribosomal protein L31 [Candidatus Woesebacteria bacterium RIFCSPHIGHO2_01_FULL_38_10]|uniref:50S ribosomal protein L31 n=1 Tax=Candidatus Woesebacteria bacterium RIFCSPLOWO2_01_FULL_39_10b TaxID=1802517 RepID=A0A1F8BAV8_9BACT|nr:MAG: 50S ribosomal protein L31 [Candidatus Woesebacteria bacterium RIFCSPHIGHO2_01_FULL_38_10]OGM60488.1 MAG: 50S ribosomal protein L31 [Candidatus Woesebacteria bacterium RIFCSPLOWO2_01_FULL_39_10b]
MKAKIHPRTYFNAKVSCACGNIFTTASTLQQITVEVCSACHPFYTGQMKYVDTAGRVTAFKQRKAKAQKKVISKTEKRKLKHQKKIEKELKKPETLGELRKKAKEKKKKKES